MCLLAICMSSGKMSISIFCPLYDLVIFFFILSCMNCLYILEINPLLVVSFPDIFSHFEGCIFILFMITFAVQKLLSLIRFYLFIFASILLL